MVLALRGVEDLADVLPDSRVRDRLVLFGELPPGMPTGEVVQRFGASGYVVETVPLALFLARRMTAESFADELAALVEAGGDTDTIGSIAGQLAGARLGLSRLPPDLVALAPVQEVIAPAQAFARSVMAV